MWQGIINVLFPKRCLGCEIIIPHFQNYICEKCKSELPFSGIMFNYENLIWERINEQVKIEFASSLLLFENGNITQKLIHQLKYKNMPEIGAWLAEIWYEINKDNLQLKEIEVVVPIPIHKKRLKKRNYNQVHLCAEKLSKLLKCKLDTEILKRAHHLDSQTLSGRGDRQRRLQNAFKRTNNQSGHYLLVDDVCTTGATLTACAEELLQKSSSKVSIFTLSFA